MMHKKACKQFAEDKKTKDIDYWNHFLWSDETKINLFGSDGVKCVWRQPGEEYKWHFSTAWYGTVRHGSVRYGTAQFGLCFHCSLVPI